MSSNPFRRGQMEPDSFVPGVPNEVMLAGLALRFELLQVATLYGLRDAVLRPQPEASVMWHAWMDWLRVVARGPDAAGDTDLVREALDEFNLTLLEGQHLLVAIDGPVTDDEALSPHDYDWTGALENIEDAARRTERFFHRVPLGEGKTHRAGVDLHGVVQDSLVLLVYGDKDEWVSGADSTEIYRLLRAARAERTWSSIDVSPSTVLPPPPGLPYKELMGRDYLAVGNLAKQLAETGNFYKTRALDDDVLSEDQRQDAIRYLRAGVFRLRALAGFDPGAAVPIPEGQPSINLRQPDVAATQVSPEPDSGALGSNAASRHGDHDGGVPTKPSGESDGFARPQRDGVKWPHFVAG